jgi:hypothetical protein
MADRTQHRDALREIAEMPIAPPNLQQGYNPKFWVGRLIPDH